LDSIAKKITDSGVLKKTKTRADVRRLIEGTEVDSLREFSRSIHAEMEAILSVAREGRHSLMRSTLYTNTYPCHNCARHIVASGISSVVYIEPYKKSLAIALHSDAISEDPTDRSRVVFRQYEGVAPRYYLRLFQPNADRKAKGQLVSKSKKGAVPVFRIPLDSPVEYEAHVIAGLSDKEGTE
jgi:deoxycytidylate deaminase